MAIPPPALPETKSPEPPPPPPCPIAAYPPAGDAAGSLASPPDSVSPDPSLRPSAGPRASSSHSLGTSPSASDPRRTLLIVYLHGFYGNDQSFGSFPAHVHNYLHQPLAGSHTLHSKIYPRYKTYRAIDVARDKFSAWLEPHESPTTDIILVGHSMGGLLAAEVALKPNQSRYCNHPFKHRILGTISLDSPFLGLHPGIVASGLSSLFQPAPKSPGAGPSPSLGPGSPSIEPQLQSPAGTPSISTDHLPHRPVDPNFDPPFFNDQPFREQPFVQRVINFGSKHWSEGLVNALGNHLTHHLEFGGCLADYHGLRSRYCRIRELEDVDELKALSDGHPAGANARVRFLNYYTLSSGRPKPQKSPSEGIHAPRQTDFSGAPTDRLDGESQEVDKPTDEVFSPGSSSVLFELKEEPHDKPRSSIKCPTVLIRNQDAHEDIVNQDIISENEVFQKGGLEINADDEAVATPELSCLSMQEMEPRPMEHVETNISQVKSTTASSEVPEELPEAALDEKQSTEQQPFLPADANLPPIPKPPKLPDLDQYTDKDSRKQAEKECKRLTRVYDQAVKDRAKTLREREKLVEKRHKKAQKEAEKLEKDARKEKQRTQKQEKKRLEREAAATENRAADDAKRAAEVVGTRTPAETAETLQRKKKMRKFCNLPSKANGAMDPTWVEVYMDGMDEVSAHCGLFFPGPHYDKLVGDVGGRIVGWVHDDLSMRALLEIGLD